MEVPVAWFFMRATGVVALLLLTVAVVVGLVGPRLRPTARLMTISMHSAAAATGTLLLAGHVALAVLDRYIDISLGAAFVPGLSDWRTWSIAAGAVALDLLILIMVSSATRRHWPSLWRRLHLLAFPMWALAWGHALTSGTDAGVMRQLAIGSGAAVTAALLFRQTRPGRPTPPPVPQLDAGQPTPDWSSADRSQGAVR